MLPGTKGFPIGKIPLEVLLRITDYLSVAELGLFRLVSRSVAAAVDSNFIDECFVRRQFMMSDFSLEGLVAMSRSRLGRSMRVIDLTLETTISGYPPPEHLQEFRRLRSLDLAFWNAGIGVEMLTTAFRNLPNLDGIIIRGRPRERTRGARVASQFSEQPDSGSQVSYGVGRANRSVGDIVFGFPNYFNESPTLRRTDKTFACIMAALGLAGARPKFIDFRVPQAASLLECALSLPRNQMPSVDPVLDGLVKLHLHVSPDPLELGMVNRYEERQVLSHQNVIDFLKRTPNVQDLRINTVSSIRTNTGPLLGWLGGHDEGGHGSQPAPAVARQPPLSHLTNLSFGFMKITSVDLLTLLRDLASTLKDLELYKVTLESRRPYPPPLHMRRPMPAKAWMEFFEGVSSIPDHSLQYLRASMAKELVREAGSKSAEVSFAKSPSCEFRRRGGDDWKDALDAAAERVALTILKSPIGLFHDDQELSEDDFTAESDGDDDIFESEE